MKNLQRWCMVLGIDIGVLLCFISCCIYYGRNIRILISVDVAALAGVKSRQHSASIVERLDTHSFPNCTRHESPRCWRNERGNSYLIFLLMFKVDYRKFALMTNVYMVIRIKY